MFSLVESSFIAIFRVEFASPQEFVVRSSSVNGRIGMVIMLSLRLGSIWIFMNLIFVFLFSGILVAWAFRGDMLCQSKIFYLGKLDKYLVVCALKDLSICLCKYSWGYDLLDFNFLICCFLKVFSDQLLHSFWFKSRFNPPVQWKLPWLRMAEFSPFTSRDQSVSWKRGAYMVQCPYPRGAWAQMWIPCL